MAAGDILDVQSDAYLGSATGDLVFATVPSGASVLFIASGWHVTLAPSTTSVTDNFGNTYTRISTAGALTDPAGDANPNGVRFYLATNVTAGGALTATISSFDFAVAIGIVIDGPLTYQVADVVANNGSGGGTAAIGPTVVTPVPNSWFIAVGTSDVDTGLSLSDAGWNVVGDNGLTAGMVAEMSVTEGAGFPGQQLVAQVKRSSTVESSTFTVAGGASWKTVILSFSVASPAPVDYEDPCSITDPNVYLKVETGTETLKFSVRPWRETAAQGGYGTPRLLEFSPVVKSASDPVTGALSVQSATIRNADTDRVIRAASANRTSLRGCDAVLYLTSKAHSLAGGAPRVLLAGKVYSDAADENLVHGLQINDPIGAGYSLTSDEARIPQRVIGPPHFPNCPAENIGKPEPPLVGRHYPLKPTEGEGVIPATHVGRITIGGAAGTPTGTTLADIVAALNASGATSTIKADYGGSRIGYADADVLQAYYDANGTVPTDYDGLANIIGYSDLDPWLGLEAVTGGAEYVAALVSAHAIAAIRDGLNANPSVWIDDLQLDPAQLGTQWWAPQIAGDGTWASAFGADLFTDIVGTDGVTRRYTLILFAPGSTYGDLVEAGGQVHLDADGAEDEGDGTGTAITDYFDCYLWLLTNFGLQTYYSGAYLSIPQFLYADGVTYLDRINADSFAAASAVWALDITGGLQGSFYLGDGPLLRDFVANANVSGGCQLAQDDYGRYFVKVPDRRRDEFFRSPDGTLHRTIRDKVDILPGFRVEPKPEWQCNQLIPEYAKNHHTGQYERSEAGGTAPEQNATSIVRDGLFKKTVQFAYLREDISAAARAAQYIRLFGDLPFVAKYARRGLCGLEDDLLQGLPITHYNGFGASGWVDNGALVQTRTFKQQLYCEYTAWDFEGVIAALEAEETEERFIVSDPIALDDIVADDGSGDLILAD